MMTQNIKNGDCTPRLRFPEFEGSTWYQIKLNELCHLKAGSLISSSSIKDHKSKDLYPCYGGNGLRGFTNQFNYDGEFPLIGRQGEFCGNIKLAHGKFYATEHAIVASVKEKNFIKFIYYLLENSKLNKIATGQAQPGLSVTLLNKFITAIPQIKEQQKIADCLTSLDDLITAHEQKAEALRQHKKGLMQRLLPAEGDATPRWRFPEFREAGEWSKELLGNLVSVAMCKRIFAEETNPLEGVPFYKIGTLGSAADSFISYELFNTYRNKYNYPEKGEILITCSGTIGKIVRHSGEDAYYQDSNIVWLKNDQRNVINNYLFYFFEGFNWEKLNSTTITRIYGDDLRNILLCFPPKKKEQQKIADCLSSLDERITAQEAKVAALREHKKGLMQRLFP